MPEQVTELTNKWIKADAINRLLRALYVAVVVQVLNAIIPQIVTQLTTNHPINWVLLGHSAITIGGQALGAFVLRYLDKTPVPTPQPPTDPVVVAAIAADPSIEPDTYVPQHLAKTT